MLLFAPITCEKDISSFPHRIRSTSGCGTPQDSMISLIDVRSFSFSQLADRPLIV